MTAPIFQADDILEPEKDFCKCLVKKPFLNGHHNHWVCMTCGKLIERKHRCDRV